MIIKKMVVFFLLFMMICTAAVNGSPLQRVPIDKILPAFTVLAAVSGKSGKLCFFIGKGVLLQSRTQTLQQAKKLVMQDLEMEMFFNGAAITGEESPYAPYMPVYSETFYTVSDLEERIQTLYADPNRRKQFLDLCMGENPLFKDIEGKLYANTDIGGKGLPLYIDETDCFIKTSSDRQAVIVCPYRVEMDGWETGQLEVPLVWQDGIWKLGKGVYELWDVSVLETEATE